MAFLHLFAIYLWYPYILVKIIIFFNGHLVYLPSDRPINVVCAWSVASSHEIRSWVQFVGEVTLKHRDLVWDLVGETLYN